MQGRYAVINQVGFPPYFLGGTENFLSHPPLPRHYHPFRYHKGYSSHFLLDSLIIRYFNPASRHRLKENLQYLPRYLLQILYEWGLEIVLVNEKFAEIGQLQVNETIYQFKLENFRDQMACGAYLSQGRMLILAENRTGFAETNPAYYFVAKVLEHSMLSNPRLRSIRAFELQPNTSMALPHILEVSLQTSVTYFCECFHDYYNPYKNLELKEKDRLLFRLLEAYTRRIS